MKTNQHPSLLLASLALFLTASQIPTHAADGTWNGGGGSGDRNWTSTSNWVSGTVPSATTDNATFSTATNKTVTVDSAQSINWLSIPGSVSGYTFNGSQLTLNSALNGSSTAALRLSARTHTIFDNAVHFAAASATIDLGYNNSQPGSLTFNSTVTSAGNISTIGRDFGGNATPSQLNFNGNVNLNSGAGGFTSASGPLVITLAGTNTWSYLSLNSYNATTTTSALQLKSDGALTSGSTLYLNGAYNNVRALDAARSYNVAVNLNGTGTTAFDGAYDLTFSGTTTLQPGGVNQTLDIASTRVALTGNLTGNATAGLIKAGNGTLVIGSAGKTIGTYGNATTVNAGTLLINGSLTDATGAADIVTVNSNATLGGTGSIARVTTISGSGILSAGDSAANNGVGTLTFASGGNLTLATGAKLKFDLNGTGSLHDLILTNGGINLGTGNTFTFAFANLGIGTYSANTWATIWTNSAGWGTTLADNTFAFGTLTGGLSGGEFQVSGNDLQVRFSAIPEPSTWALLAVSLTAIMILRRRRA